MFLNLKNNLFYILFIPFLISCSSNIETDRNKEKQVEHKDSIPKKNTVFTQTPNFNADSAYYFIEKQVLFGPRVPNSKEHSLCAQWLQSSLENYGFKVMVQKGKVTAFNGLKLNISNIIASHNSESKNRIMLCAHWDTRPFADRDTVNINFPIDGANDGASGVGVLLEIARNIFLSDPETGVDILLFDAEDYGARSMGGQIFDINTMNDTWCLGSQYWCKNPTFENYKPRYGILLDMIGAKDAKFPKEGISRQYANQKLIKIWNTASSLGYGNYFVNQVAPPITDDHTYINQLAGIPTIDIIHYIPRYSNGRFDFGKFHHTHNDNMSIIHKPTLKAVGQTILHVVYQKI